MQLNPQQREAVELVHTPLLVLAGAGSGKTRVITKKISYLVNECGHEPGRIVAVTFTNKAAREMKSRTGQNLRKNLNVSPIICTFHMLGLKIIRHSPEQWGLKRGFTIYANDESQILINDIIRKRKIGHLESIDQIMWHISKLKADSITPEMAIKMASSEGEFRISRIFADYQASLTSLNSLDLDDLIYLPVTQLKENRKLLFSWQEKIDYMLVDEYQDTNSAQYELLKLLTNHHHRFTVVGDDDQSIYSWRGANPTNLKRISQDFANLKVIKLEQNYRSSKRILQAANSLIAKNSHLFTKKLWSNMELGDRIRVIQANDEFDEAERVIKAMYAHQKSTQEAFHKYAILYRGNHQAKPFERVLREYNINYFLSGGTSFFERSEVKDILAYIKLIANPDDDNAFIRIVNTPRREIGISTLNTLKTYASETHKTMFSCCLDLELKSKLKEKAISKLQGFYQLINNSARLAQENPLQAVKELILSINYESWCHQSAKDSNAAKQRIDNVNELLSWIKRLQDKEKLTISELVQKMVLMDILDRNEDDRKDRVHMMTLHAAKGLEFPYVYIVGMEEGLLPHHANQNDSALEEERRIAYVGMTRAQSHLTFSLAVQRSKLGGSQLCVPSRFLDEINPDYLIWDNDPLAQKRNRKNNQQQIDQLKALLRSKQANN